MRKESPHHRFSIEDLHTAIDEMAKMVSKHKTIVIAGSQAMLASIPPEKWEETEGVQHSQDIDLFCIPEMDNTTRAEIKTKVGEDSTFQKENGWALEPIGEWVMMTSLPEWPERMLKIETPNRNVGYCISPLDTIFNKAEAGREKDVTYIKEAIKVGLIKPSQIAEAIKKYGDQLAAGTAERVNKTMQAAINQIASEKTPNPIN